MPPHEALRAIMLGNQLVYTDEYSVIGNPFDARLSRTQLQLVRLYVLSALVNYAGNRSFQFLPGAEIVKSLRHIGVGDEATLQVLRDLCRMRFITTASHSSATLEASYVPTRLGGYIVRDLITNMTFLENVMMDTFIADDEIWNILKNLTTAIYATRDTIQKLNIRRQRVGIFYDFMSKSFDLLHEEGARRGLPSEWCSRVMHGKRPDLIRNLTQVARSAERNYGPKAERDDYRSG
jgi:hypothetical protein